jgi:hypothetical protein
METEDLKEKAEDLTSHLGDYLDTFYRLTVLNVTQKATNIASAVMSTIVVCTLGLFVLFFTGFGMAWWLGDVLKSRAGGFLIVAGFFLLVVLGIILFRKKIIFPWLRNQIIRKIYE